MYWCCCTGRTVSFREYCNLLWIDVFVLAELYWPLIIVIHHVLMSLYWQDYIVRDYCNWSCIDVFVLAGLYRSVTLVMYHVLIYLYWQDYIDPWLLLFFMYWWLCTYRTISIRDYCNLSFIDVSVLAGLYRSVTFIIFHVLMALYWHDYIYPWFDIYHASMVLYIDPWMLLSNPYP